MEGGWFYNGRDGKFLKSLQIVGRGVLIPLFYEDPLYSLPSFFKFCPTTSPTSLSPPIFTPTAPSVVDLHMSSLETLAPEES